ncbi:MAG: ParA family protein [Atribacterota bacterium]
MGKIVTFSNRKGGTGKTTVAVNVAALLGDQGTKCLLIDLDSQAHATVHLGLNPLSVRYSVYEALIDFLEGKRWKPELFCVVENLTVAPSNQNLAALDVELSRVQDGELILRDFLLEMEASFDYLIIDTPPSLGFTTLSALVATQYLVIPTKIDFLSGVGLAQMMELYYRVSGTLNPLICFLGIVPTFFETRTRFGREILSELSRTFGVDKIFPPLRQDIKVMEASSHAMPVHRYAPHCRAAQDMRMIVAEMVERMKRQ